MSVPIIEPAKTYEQRNAAIVPPRKFHLQALPPVQAVAPPAPQVDLARLRQPAHSQNQGTAITVQELKEETACFIFKNRTFKAGSKLVNAWIKKECYEEAYEVCIHLYDLNLTDAQKSNLLKTLESLAARGHEVIGKPFYAWIRCVLTCAVEEKSPNPTEAEIQAILRGYTEAADLGSYFARYNLAMFYSLKLLNHHDALKHLIKYTEEHPERSFGYKELASFYLIHLPNETEAAKAALRRGLSIDECDPACGFVQAELALMLAEILEKSSESTQEAIDLYKKAKNDEKAEPLTRSKAAFNLAVIAQRKKELQDALALFTESKELASHLKDPEYDATVDYAIAETLLMDSAQLTKERNAEALKLLASAKAQENRDAELLHAKLLAQGNRFVAKDVEGAINALSRLEKKAEEYSDTFIQLQSHLTLAALTEPAQAAKSLLTANRLLSKGLWDDQEAYRAQVDSAMKSQFDALIIENSALKEQLEASRAKAKELEEKLALKKDPVSESWEKEIEVQQIALEQHPEDDEALFTLALSLHQKGDHKQAIEKCLEYMERGDNKQDWKPWSVIGRAFNKQGDLKNALKYITASLQLNDSIEENKKLQKELQRQLFDEAKALYDTKKTAEALEKFKELEIENCIGHKKNQILHYISMCYSRQRKYDEAFHFVNQAILANKAEKMHYNLRVQILINKKDFDTARRYIEQMKRYNDPVEHLEKQLPKL